MKKILVVLFTALVLVACGGGESDKEEEEVNEDKETYISNDDIIFYTRELLEPYIKLKESEDEIEVLKVLEGMDQNTREITNELKDVYEDEIQAIHDLEELAHTLEEFVKERNNLIDVYDKEIDRLVYTIAYYYWDGFLPVNYADMKGIENIDELEELEELLELE